MREFRRRLERLEQHFTARDCTCCLPLIVVIDPDPTPDVAECLAHPGSRQGVVRIRRFTPPPGVAWEAWRSSDA